MWFDDGKPTDYIFPLTWLGYWLDLVHDILPNKNKIPTNTDKYSIQQNIKPFTILSSLAVIIFHPRKNYIFWISIIL